MTTNSSRLSPATILAHLGLVVGCGLAAYLIWPRSSDSYSGFVATHRTATNLDVRSVKPIESLRVGDRVLANNPEVSDEERLSWSEPDWARWLRLSLVMPKGDGSELTMELLRTEDWLRDQLAWIVAEENAVVGEASTDYFTIPDNITEAFKPSPAETSVVDSPLRPVFQEMVGTFAEIDRSGLQLAALVVEMNLPELGISGPAVVTDVRAAPVVRKGDGQVVTATFHHTSGEVIDLTIGDEIVSETIGTTSNHPFWSVDRREYVQAGTLQLGEQVLTRLGETKLVLSKLPRPGPAAVFNLEVHGEHVYYVGPDGILVHNSKSYRTPSIKNSKQGHLTDDLDDIVVRNPYGKGTAKIKRNTVAGDHRLPQQSIKDAVGRAQKQGLKLSPDQMKRIEAIQDGRQNLVPMSSPLNSSKGDRNMVQWAKTEMGGQVSARYRAEIHRTQRSVADKINKVLNEGKRGRPKDFFREFFDAT